MAGLVSTNQINYIKYFAKITRHPPAATNVSAPIEFVLQYQYVHPAPDLWLRYDPVAGEITRYKIFKNQIVGADTLTVIDPVTNNKRTFIYRYFKTEVLSTEKGATREN